MLNGWLVTRKWTILFFAAIATSLALCAAPALAAPEWTTFLLAEGASSHYADAEDRRVVWSSGSQIQLFDLSANTTTPLNEDKQWAVYNPSISGDRVVWSGAMATNQVGIFLHDLSDGTPRIIADDLTFETADPPRPLLEGGKVTWWRSAAGNVDVISYDIATATRTQITEGEADEYPLAVNDRSLVFVGRETGNSHLSVYDYGTGQIRQVGQAAGEFGIGSAVMEGDVVAWIQTDDSSPWGSLRAFDLGTGEGRTLASGVDPSYPCSMDGGRVVWVGNDADIHLFDLATGESVKLSTNPEQDRYPTIEANGVVWEGGDGHDWEIFFHDLRSGATQQITANDRVGNFLDQGANWSMLPLQYSEGSARMRLQPRTS